MLTEAMPRNIELAEGTLLLRGQYDIECPLSKGGFGITYLARDSLNRKVVIKECFPQNFCDRRGSRVSAVTKGTEYQFDRILEQFKREAFRVAALDHPGVVKVHQVFEENGTAFLAMDHINGEDLFEIADMRMEQLDAECLKALLIEALDAVAYIHAEGLLHRDLAPDNFILGVDNHLTLIDFGSACDAVVRPDAADAKLLAVKDGFSPPEFYTGEAQDLSSDMYSLGATFHYLVTGYAPPSSQIRSAAVAANQPDPFQPLLADDWDLDDAFLAPINQALALDRTKRLASAEDWLRCITDVQAPAEIISEAAPTMKSAPAAQPASIVVSEISQLVSETNSTLTRGMPGKMRKDDARAERERQKAKAAKTRQRFDIFGNPVDDVEAFMREQDKASKKRQSAPAGKPNEPKAERSRSALGRILGKLRPGNKAMKSAIPQN